MSVACEGTCRLDSSSISLPPVLVCQGPEPQLEVGQGKESDLSAASAVDVQSYEKRLDFVEEFFPELAIGGVCRDVSGM